MINTNLAPNEGWDDAWLSLKLLFQPWRWQTGDAKNLIADKLRKFFPGTDSFMFLSGRSALFNLIKCLNLPANSKVLVQAFTCEAVVLPILANGLKPVYIDIEPETYSMNILKLQDTPEVSKAKIIILQHSFGLTPKYRKEILGLAKKNDLFVIEDLAHGFNQKIYQSDAYFLSSNLCLLLSFGRSKMVSSVFGSAIVTADKNLKRKLSVAEKSLKKPSSLFIFKLLLYKPLIVLIKSTYEIFLGKVFHLVFNKFGLLVPEISALEKQGKFDNLLNKSFPNALNLLLNHQFNKLDQINRQRLIVVEIYNSIFKQSLTVPAIRYPILTNSREKVIKLMIEKEIHLGNWYDQVVAPKDLNLKRVGYTENSCPCAEDICKKIINLPTNISNQEAKKVVLTLNDVILKYGN